MEGSGFLGGKGYLGSAGSEIGESTQAFILKGE